MNILLVCFVFECLGVEVDVLDDVKVIKSVDKVFLFGVGIVVVVMVSIK